MSSWLVRAGAETNSELSRPRVRVFHDALVRHFHAMQRTQKCLELHLSTQHFPVVQEGHAGRVFMCRVADNMSPRVWTQDRELVLRLVSPGLIGVDPVIHGGPWLSQALVDTFIYGCDDYEVPLTGYLCPRALDGKCPGRKTLCLSKDKKKDEVTCA
jgi:hypothetical protein